MLKIFLEGSCVVLFTIKFLTLSFHIISFYGPGILGRVMIYYLFFARADAVFFFPLVCCSLKKDIGKLT